MATFTNRATLSYNGRVTDSNTVTGTIAETLAITKTALTETYTPGDTLTYVIGLTNTGATTVNGLTVTDDLGTYPFEGGTVTPLTYVEGSATYFINGAPAADPTVNDTQPLTVSGLTVPTGGNALLIYQATANSFAPPVTDGSITNTVTLTGVPEALTAEETVTAVNRPELTITKELTPTTVPENGSLTYTFVISNFGNTAVVATDDAVVTDLFDPILTITSVTLDGATLAEGTGYTYDETTGQFSTAPTVITVPAATYTREADGSFTVTPGTVTLTVSGTI